MNLFGVARKVQVAKYANLGQMEANPVFWRKLIMLKYSKYTTRDFAVFFQKCFCQHFNLLHEFVAHSEEEFGHFARNCAC